MGDIWDLSAVVKAGYSRNLELPPTPPIQEDESGIRQKRKSDDEDLKRRIASKKHNLAEKKRRDRFSDAVTAMKELICSKEKDQASILEDSIIYTKNLQNQAQAIWTTWYQNSPAWYQMGMYGIPYSSAPQAPQGIATMEASNLWPPSYNVPPQVDENDLNSGVLRWIHNTRDCFRGGSIETMTSSQLMPPA